MGNSFFLNYNLIRIIPVMGGILCNKLNHICYKTAESACNREVLYCENCPKKFLKCPYFKSSHSSIQMEWQLTRSGYKMISEMLQENNRMTIHITFSFLKILSVVRHLMYAI